MKLNYWKKQLSNIGRWMAASLLCVSAFSFVWQGGFNSNNAALAAPTANSVLVADAGDRVQEKAGEDAKQTKNFIRDAADKVKRTANKNADRVDRATDNNGNFVQRKANRDAARIEERADRDAARTQKAVDKTKNAVQRTVDKTKDALSN
ncbi:MAG: hypothetical protein KME17_26875 [Cyanosarcina radialis HA8281-LM2]|jgi:hypothetical protein|nr:hypothetical protein [Cyanosarcina radialis HA8281-LM2]